jgi:hypothetical protein
VVPFIASLPPRLPTPGFVPEYQGRWRGEYVRVGCRAPHAGSCTRDFDPLRNRPIEVEFAQSGTTITGTFRIESGLWSFAGYVTLSAGVAATATSTSTASTATSSSRWFLVLEPSAGTLVGSFSHDTVHESSGATIQSRKYDLAVPLRRVD